MMPSAGQREDNLASCTLFSPDKNTSSLKIEVHCVSWWEESEVRNKVYLIFGPRYCRGTDEKCMNAWSFIKRPACGISFPCLRQSNSSPNSASCAHFKTVSLARSISATPDFLLFLATLLLKVLTAFTAISREEKTFNLSAVGLHTGCSFCALILRHADLTSGSFGSSGKSALNYSITESRSWSLMNVGPENQLDSINFSTDKPRDAMSAGLLAVFT